MGAKKNKIVAIVPAAGIGKRFGKGKNKSLYELFNKPLIVWVLEALQAVAEIDEIILVLKRNDFKPAMSLIERYNISKAKKVVTGGKERQDSVYNGLKGLGNDTSVVVIHDGARPFADSELIRRTILELNGFDGVVAAVPVKDTIKAVSSRRLPLAKGGIIEKTLNRDVLWSAQTPQTFYFHKIKDAHKRARSEGYYSTDDAALIEKYGGRVKVIMGSYSNIKITTPEDIYIAEALLKL